MKFIITENQYSRLLSEQQVYTSQTEYDNAMIKYEKDLKQYNIDYQNYKNELKKWQSDEALSLTQKRKVPKKYSPGRKPRGYVTINDPISGTENLEPKPTFNKKKPAKPIYKEIKITSNKTTEIPSLSPQEIKKRFDACSKDGIQVGTPHREYTFYKLPNKEFIEGGWGCDKNGIKKSFSELINLGILK